MKRSPHLTLTLMAAGAALTACSEPGVTHAVAESSDDCKVNDLADAQACERAFDQALYAHFRDAPRFQGREACLEQFGYCTPAADNAGMVRWQPAMAGYLMTYAPAQVNGVDCNAEPRNAACRDAGTGRRVIAGAPLYREFGTGEYFTADNASAGYRTGLLRGAPSGSRGTAYARPSARGGFGRSGFFGG